MRYTPQAVQDEKPTPFPARRRHHVGVVMALFLAGAFGCSGGANSLGPSSNNGSKGGGSSHNQVVTTVPLTVPTSDAGLAPIDGQPYARQFEVWGGTPPYTWALTAGTLPQGLTLASSGLITGTTNSTASYDYTVTATDAAGASVGLEITGKPNGTGTFPFHIVQDDPLPVFGQGQHLGFVPFVEGGTPPYSFKVSGLPAGVTYDRTTGLLSGVPTDTGTFNLQINVHDSKGIEAKGSPLTGTLFVIPPLAPVAGKRYDGTWIGEFVIKYCIPDPNLPLGHGCVSTGTASFNISVKFAQLGPSAGGHAVLSVTHVTIDNPAFGCTVGGCTIDGVASASVLQVSDPPVNVDSQGGDGLQIFFPNGATLQTANAPGDFHMNSVGTVIGSTPTADQSKAAIGDGLPDAWGASTPNAVEGYFFRDYMIPGNPTTFLITHSGWVLAHSAL